MEEVLNVDECSGLYRQYRDTFDESQAIQPLLRDKTRILPPTVRPIRSSDERPTSIDIGASQH
ncbi:hypothetical protein T265_05612 [Opisthorchis viverrini]|uniref:Uncharacterized protein n=1 Tax=Opisthorchis viverrini TaxID=6198 RepID=A0A074ZJU5_OPIVI|nr:hypothetical protein T265_05612 [Opisthorchis viverrini]KER27286.1 hypothetical protein T265_05612 [Opisthorchis viverrini]